jgi:ubiquinol-cytochrome c reductase cytochrome b subunit
MPAYGNALNPSETKALVSFLKTLRGNNLSPAIDASRSLTNTSHMRTASPGSSSTTQGKP